MSEPSAKPRRPRRKPASKVVDGGLISGYSKTERPLGGYAMLIGLFTLGLGSALGAIGAKKDEDVPALRLGDLLLLGVATHKLSRIVSKDIVTSPLRAPFVKWKKDSGAGEVEEEARGEGLREAIGDLITCPYCVSPWVASSLVIAHNFAPRATRLVCSIFSLTAASDFLNQLYARAKD